MLRSLIVVISDPHCGNIYGWMRPGTVLNAIDKLGNSYQYKAKLNEIQNYLYQDLTVPALKFLKKANKKDLIAVVSTGDITHGNGHKEELITTRISDQNFIAEEAFLPFVELEQTKIVRFILGTGVHEFGEGSASFTVAKLLQNRFPKKDIQAFYHGHSDIAGFTLDYSHHGPNTGSRKWLEGNEARYYLRDLMMKEFSMGNRPPNLVLRGHYHERVKEYLSIVWTGIEHESWLYVMPSMCMIGDFGRKATKSRHLITNGIIIYEVIDGKLYDIHEFKKTLDIRTKEKWV